MDASYLTVNISIARHPMAGLTISCSLPQRRRDASDDHDNTKRRPASADVESMNKTSKRPQTALQQHVAFFDRDEDGVIWPADVYNGFRELGFGVPFSLGSLLIPVFFSYPTRLGRSWVPDPLLRIWVADVHRARHGSDAGVYDLDGCFAAARFDRLFDRFDVDRAGGLTPADLAHLLSRDRCAADPAGWSFAFMEWWTTWLLLQRDGRVWKDDLRACYDGSLFWKISEERAKGDGWQKGYGVNDFLYSMWYSGTWKSWEAKTK
ncbi:Caleosin-domain-containing protein [Hypoxylon sp. FL1284]|nr:Caleosin-domain-containing protein [Hypoxylon sp. FL1284]